MIVQAAQGTASITSYYSQQKKPAGMAAVPTKHMAHLAEQLRESRAPRGLASGAMGPKQHAATKTTAASAAAVAASEPRQNAAGGTAASHPEDDNWQSGVKPGTTAMPDLLSSMPNQCLAQPHADSSSVGSRRRHADSNSCDDLLLQSPYATRLRQQVKGSATKPGFALSSQTGSGHESEEEAERWNRAAAQRCDCYPSAFASSSEGEQHQSNAAASRPKDWLVKGHLSNSPGRLPRSPHAKAAQAGLFTSPKRSARSCQEETIVISPSSQSQEDLEVCLLSPSPAKRYATTQLGLTLAQAVFPCFVIRCCIACEASDKSWKALCTGCKAVLQVT